MRVQFAELLEMVKSHEWRFLRTLTRHDDDMKVTRIWVFAPPKGMADEPLVALGDADGTVSRATFERIRDFLRGYGL
ncbi:MAG: hypothetical protein IH986_17595 [Planctomycetes bacterium]|nr:hypothetical protein [Planctomycetota bacterium]